MGSLVCAPRPGKLKLAAQPVVGNKICSMAGLMRVTMELGSNSGMGKEGPKYAVREMTEEKMIVIHLRE